MSFKRVQGQERALQILRGILSRGNIPSALLFAGPEGVGKALTAHEFAKTLLCRTRLSPARACGSCPDCVSIDKAIHPDVKNVNALYQASLREEDPAKQKTLRIETIRHLRKDMELVSMLGNWKIAIVEQAHTLEIEAANALLKILEEPLPETLWILTSSQKERIPKTVLSRCCAIPFAPLPGKIVEDILVKNGIDQPRAAAIAKLCEGSLSPALKLHETEYPSCLTRDPLAAADSLPRELYLARTQVELALFALSQDLRLRHLNGLLAFGRVERPLREIDFLRQALRANADPRTVMMLACLEAQKVS